MSEDVLPREGPAAPPRSNGELLFAEPWESRVFGVTLALHERGHFAWPEFQACLIEAIRRRETGPDEFHYYACWLEALGELAARKGWVAGGALEAVERELAARPPGHDHRHD